MNCPSCGANLRDEASFCERCGQQVAAAPFSSYQVPPRPSRDDKVIWIVAIVIIVVVVVPLALSAVMYYMVVGHGSDGMVPGVMVSNMSEIENGFKMVFTATTSEVVWSDVTIQLSDGADTVSWNGATTEALTSTMPPAVWHGGHKTSGGLVGVYLNITDLAGNGRMSNGDFITFQMPAGFESTVTYTLTLVYEPVDGSMMSYTFTGQTANTPGINVMRKRSIGTGFMIEFTAPTEVVEWSDVTIYLFGDVDSLSWDDVTTEALTSTTPPAVWHGAQMTNGTLVGVYLNITDLAANGRMSYGDYVTVQMPGGFSPSVTYALMLFYEPSLHSMLDYSFTG